MEGIIQVTRRGVGYVPFDSAQGKPSQTQDIEIQTADLHGALNGDTVAVELTGVHPRPKGKVVKIETRAKEEFVCSVRAGKIIPDDVRFYAPIGVDTKDFADGDKILVKLISFDGTVAKGIVLKHLGRAGDHRTEMNAIVLEHGFDTEFSAAVQREAREIEKNHAATIAAEVPKRIDFRGVPTMTIDPKDAKDFDDALSVRKIGEDWELGVHIADATFFVHPGTALDDEATKRGTSVYLVDTTIPMLPHELSANVCSLREGEDRLAFSAIFRIHKNGEVLERRFEKSIIRSQKRFTYEEAQEILDDADHTKDSHLSEYKGLSFVTELLTLRDLARLFKKQREKDGAIDFGDSEVRFVLDKAGKPIDIVRKERIETNSLVEECMLLANREVATYVSKLAEKVPEHGLIFLYRIHDTPKADRIDELAVFVRAVGYEFGKKNKKTTARDIGHLLKQIEGKPEEHLIRTATLRAMAKAIYSTKNIGHFGLAFEYYTHFTSPIRRYPDMLVHRILMSHLDGKPMTRREFGALEKMCIAASEQEAKAVDAERESIKYKQVEYMLGKIGQTFDAVVSGVTEWGLYVEDKKSAAEGLVRVRTLGDDFYNYSQKEYALVGQRTKKKFSLGDPVRIKLAAADLATRQLDFELVR
ncbi:MAG: ribonuclease R [bacterium]|nr:ribonuclease R [bacterium]